MTFEIPFDSKISLEQYSLRLKLTFKKNLRITFANIASCTVLLLVSWSLIGDRRNEGWFFLSLGLFGLFTVVQYLLFYFKRMRKLKCIYREMAELRENNSDTTVWGFEQDVFKYKDMYYDQSVKWAAFKGYRIERRNLFLMLAESIDQSYIIGEDEIGAENFAAIVTFVDERMKKK